MRVLVHDGWRALQAQTTSNGPQVTATRGTDLSGTLEVAGDIGGLLGRSHGYSAGNWSKHNFYHADGNGNVTYLVNSSQTRSASYRYDPYGNALIAAELLSYLGGIPNTYRFSSKLLDLKSGLYSYGYRWYAPNVERWLNQDPLNEPGFEVLRRRQPSIRGSGSNLYLFVRNSPISMVDFLGLDAFPVPTFPVPPDGFPKALKNPCPCGEAAAQIAAVGPLDANTARRLANQALAAALASGLPGPVNGPADAFRHCLWSCRMAQEIGAGQAKEVGDAHERCNKGSAGEEAMDQANNSTGRGFGTPGADCNTLCLQAARDGTLQTAPGGTPPANPY